MVAARTKDVWISPLIGRIIDQEKALSNGWYDQGSDHFHYGLPRKKNLWLKKISPAEKCCHTIWIFLLIEVTKSQKIKNIKYSVHQVFLDGRGEEIGVPLFPNDEDAAVREIQSILADLEDPKG